MSIINSVKRVVEGFYRKKLFPDSERVWINKYKRGNNSGFGSYGVHADFKARVLNEFVKDNGVKTVLEFGCGDGNQASLFEFPNYVGLDISGIAISWCKEKMKGDETKSFHVYNPRVELFYKAELTLSLEVLFHLIEQDVYERYLKQLFQASEKYVIIFCSNTDENTLLISPNCYLRKYTDWISNNESLKVWKLIKTIKYELGKQEFNIYEKMVEND